VERLGIARPGKVDISTSADKQSLVFVTIVRNQAATYEMLPIRTFLDGPDIELVWHIRCSIYAARYEPCAGSLSSSSPAGLRRESGI